MDNIGKAGFDYDFATLEGNHSEMAEAYNALDIAAHAGMTLVIAVLANIFPILQEIPTKKFKLVKAVHDRMEEVARKLLEREGKNEDLADFKSLDRSIIGVLSGSDRTLTVNNTNCLVQSTQSVQKQHSTSQKKKSWIK